MLSFELTSDFIQRIPSTGENHIRCLIWLPDSSSKKFPKLVSAGLSGEVSLWDFENLSKPKTEDSYGGSVWSGAILKDGKKLVFGCEDGSLRVFEVNDGGISYSKSVVGHTGRVLSVAVHPENGRIATGGADGLIQIWDSSNFQNLGRITVEGEIGNISKSKAIKKQLGSTLVWSLLWLRDGTLVSGDSLGHLQLWDSRTRTLKQSFTRLEADIMCLATTSDQLRLFASGLDSRLLVLDQKPGKSEWVVSSASRPHEFDVLTMSLIPHGESQDLLVSGGINGDLVVHLNKKSHKDAPKVLATVCPDILLPAVRLCGSHRTVFVGYKNQLQLWRLGDHLSVSEESKEQDGSVLPLKNNLTNLMQIQDGSSNNIITVAISPDTSLVAWSTAAQTKIRRLRRTPSLALDVVESDGHGCLPAATSIVLNDTLAYLAVADGTILVVEAIDDKVVIKHQFRDHVEKSDFLTSTTPQFSVQIRHLAISSCGRYLASADCLRRIFIFDTESLKLHSIAPECSSLVTALKFHPTDPILVYLCASKEFVIYDVLKKSISDWTKKNHDSLPEHYTRSHNIYSNACFNIGQPSILMLQSYNHLCTIDLDKPIPQSNVPSRKRKRSLSKLLRNSGTKPASEEDDPTECTNSTKDSKLLSNFRMIDRFRPMFFADFVGPDEVLVIQNPLRSWRKSLPNPIYRHKYGSS